MFYDQGCYGRIELGPLPGRVIDRLLKVPGEWLEYDPATSAIVVRHVQPTATRHLPAIACELLRLFAEVPPESHPSIPGGDLFVHTEEEHGQLVRFRVEAGGMIQIQWAHPDFKKALRRPYRGRSDFVVDPEIQRLNGLVRFASESPEEARQALEELAEGFEGLYPQGDLSIDLAEPSRVEVVLRDVNLDAAALVGLLQRLARPRTLSGRVEVGSFGTGRPEDRVRVLFEKGKIWVQHPLLWGGTSS